MGRCAAIKRVQAETWDQIAWAITPLLDVRQVTRNTIGLSALATDSFGSALKTAICILRLEILKSSVQFTRFGKFDQGWNMGAVFNNLSNALGWNLRF